MKSRKLRHLTGIMFMQPTTKFVDYPEFHFLFDKKYFKILYHDNDISIFEPMTKSLGTFH